MALELAAFRTSFPEFSRVEDPMVEAFLATALLSIDADIWGDHADEGHGYLAAHLLAQSPYGQNARLSAESSQTTYGIRYEELRTQVACGPRVV